MNIAKKGGGALLVVLLLLVALSIGGGGEECDPAADPAGTADAGQLSPTARAAIPAGMARVYMTIAQRQDIDVAFLASIGAQESDHGRNAAARTVNSSGCVGVMQLGTGDDTDCGNFWGRNKCDGNGDGKMEVLNTWDNVCASAKGLRGEKGAPPAGGSEEGYRRAACGYYGACGDGVANYADEVMARAKRYGFVGGTKTAELVNVSDTDDGPADIGQCDDPASDDDAAGTLADGVDGDVTYLPGANRPGANPAPALLKVVRQIAGAYGHRIIVCTGTNHSQLSSSGLPSDHWTGFAVDICSSQNGFPATGGGKGDLIAAAAFRVAGQPQAAALASGKRGGLVNVNHAGYRFQIIWKTNEGGNHFNHVHVGIKRLVAAQTAAALRTPRDLLADTHEFRLRA